MAYSVNNYHVFTAAGLETGDTDEQIYTKIANWINGILSDVGTAEVFDVNSSLKAVRFMFNDVRAGICFGHLYTSSTTVSKNFTGIVFPENSSTLSVQSVYTSYSINSIETLYMFVAVSDYGAFVCFYSTEGNNKDTAIYCLKCKDDNNAAKNCCYGFNKTSSNTGAVKVYVVQVGNESIYRVKGEGMTTNLQKDISISNKTLLTKFYIPYTDCIPDGTYLVTGNIPNAQTIFEIDGNKYVIGYNYEDRFVIALKLE